MAVHPRSHGGKRLRSPLEYEAFENRICPALITADGAALQYTAGQGIANNVSVWIDAVGDLHIRDVEAIIGGMNNMLPPGLAYVPGSNNMEVSGPADLYSDVNVNVRDGDDEVSGVGLTKKMLIQGGEGNDILVGGNMNTIFVAAIPETVNPWETTAWKAVQETTH